MGFTGEQIKGHKRTKIIQRLANGDPVIHIAKQYHHSEPTIRAIRAVEETKINEYKERMGAQAEEIAHKAGKRLIERLDDNTLPANLLPSTYGIGFDKMLAARGDAPGTVAVNVLSFAAIKVQQAEDVTHNVIQDQ